MLTPREIIAEAWAITTKEGHIRLWGFISSVFETLRNVELLLYQGYYLYKYIGNETVGFFDVELMLFKGLPLWIFIITLVITVILFVVELFIPTLASGAVIGLAAKSYKKEPVKGGLVLGLYNFFPILEIHGLFLLSGLPIMLTIFSMIIRYGGESSFIRSTALILLLLFSLISTLFYFFASFAEEAVVIKKVGVFGGIGQSFKLIISYWSHIFFLLLLMLVISIRILINATLVLLIPAVAIGIGVVLTWFLSVKLSIIIATVLGFILVILASYFLAYLHVFKQTVWTITYLELANLKELDIIE